MPEFAHEDRKMIEIENTIWNVGALLYPLTEAGAWTKKIADLHKQAVTIARELRTYNDQFETAD